MKAQRQILAQKIPLKDPCQFNNILGLELTLFSELPHTALQMFHIL